MAREKAIIDWEVRFSDSSEDFILRCLFPYTTGVYLEIGGYDPYTHSNTAIFHKTGWEGLVIEPLPHSIRKFKTLRAGRCQVEQLAASNCLGEVALNVDGMVTSIDKEWTCRHSRTPDKVVQYMVKCEPLWSILARHEAIRRNCDFVSLDVEGWERQVLEGNKWDGDEGFKPAVWCIEGVKWKPLLRNHAEWEHFMLDNGYELIVHNLQNRFYGLVDHPFIWQNAMEYNLCCE